MSLATMTCPTCGLDWRDHATCCDGTPHKAEWIEMFPGCWRLPMPIEAWLVGTDEEMRQWLKEGGMSQELIDEMYPPARPDNPTEDERQE